jgi:hypothetical protein
MNTFKFINLERTRETIIYNMHRYYEMSKKQLGKILYETYGIRMHRECRKWQYIDELMTCIINDLDTY